MNSHEYATHLEEFAAQLKKAPEFPVPDNQAHGTKHFWYLFEKDKFIQAVKILGPGKKDLSGMEQVRFHPELIPELELKVEKKDVCRMVKPAEYECDSWLEQFQ